MSGQCAFQIPLIVVFGHCQEIENIGVFECLYSKIGHSLSFPFIQTAFYLVHQNAAAPVVGKGALHIIECLIDMLALGNNGNVVSPWNSGDVGNRPLSCLANNLLAFFSLLNLSNRLLDFLLCR